MDKVSKTDSECSIQTALEELHKQQLMEAKQSDWSLGPWVVMLFMIFFGFPFNQRKPDPGLEAAKETLTELENLINHSI